MKERRIIQVATATDHSLALCDDGTIWVYAAGSWDLFPPIPQPEASEGGDDGQGSAPPWLDQLCAALDWQGGTAHDAIRAVKRLVNVAKTQAEVAKKESK